MGEFFGLVRLLRNPLVLVIMSAVALATAFPQTGAAQTGPTQTGAAQAGSAQTGAAKAGAAQPSLGAPDAGPAQPRLLTLDEAISLAVANHPSIKQAQAQLTAARAAVGEALSLYYPKVAGALSYTRVEPDQSFTFPGLGTFSLAQEDNWDFHVGLDQLLFASGRPAISARLARSGVGAAEIGLAQVEMSLAYETVQTFYTALFLEEQVASLDQQLSDLEQHLAATQKKEQTGSATSYDLLSTQVRVASLRGERIDAHNQYLKALIELKSLAGLGPDVELSLRGDIASQSAADRGAADEQALLAQALADRPEVKRALAAEEATGLDLDLARLGAFPTLSAHAQAGFQNGLLPDSGSLTFNWSAGVRLTVPIFDGLDTASQIQEAQGRAEAARQNSAAARSRVAADVLEACQDLSASRESERNSQIQLQQAQAALDAAKIQYDLGVTTNVEYLDAQAALARARLESLAALFREVLSDYALRRAAGLRIWAGG